jgi:hypothetical protein
MGVTFPAFDFFGPKVLHVTALTGTTDATRFEAEFTPTNGHPDEIGTAFVHLNALQFKLRALCADPTIAENIGLFLQRNPTAITPGSFAGLKFSMHPFNVIAQPGLSMTTEVILEYESGSSAIAALHDATGALVPLPKTWTLADFDPITKELDKPFFLNGAGYGEAVLKLRYLFDGSEVATRRLKVRVSDLPGLAGKTTAVYPFFLYQRVANEGQPISVAIDPGRFAERANQAAAIYVVPHRARADWATNNSLAGAVIAPISVVIISTTVSSNTTILTPGPVAGDYDIVYDFGNCPDNAGGFITDGTLDPGDIIDTIVTDQPSIAVLPPLLDPGPQAPLSAEYGTGPSPVTTTVVGGYDGLVATFDFRLRGKVVYPDPLPPGKLPLVVIAHGNHMPLHLGGSSMTVPASITTDENYRGHTYLQEHLATYGYVSLSVDLDEMYGDPAAGYPAIAGFGIALRGNVIARNIDLFLNTVSSTIAGGALAGKIDEESIYLVGHSRGGEAVLLAQALLAGTHPRPSATPAFSTPASALKGIISISPVSAMTVNPPSDMPYLLLYGSADGDVNGASHESVWPFKHFDRSTGPSHVIYAIGANHNYFNESWPASDASQWIDTSVLPPVINSLVMPVGVDLLSRSEQQDLAKAYILAFLRAYHENQASYLEYFTSVPSLLRPAGIASTIPLSHQARPPTRTIVDHYESNISTTLASSGAVVMPTVTNLSEAALHDIDVLSEAEVSNRFFQETRGALFDWVTASRYRFLLTSPEDLRESSIAIRFAQQPQYIGASLQPSTPIDLRVTIEDGSGNQSSVQISAWAPLRAIYQSNLHDSGPPGGEPPVIGETTKAVFETRIIPWWAFVADGRIVDLAAITKITIDVGGAGLTTSARIGVDDVEIWP